MKLTNNKLTLLIHEGHFKTLTNLLLLCDDCEQNVYGIEQSNVTDTNSFAIGIISYIGCILSIIGIVFTLLTFFLFR